MSTDKTLPPMPGSSQAFSLTRSIYTAEDMHDFARAALAAQAEAHADQLAIYDAAMDALRAEVAQWKEAWERAMESAREKEIAGQALRAELGNIANAKRFDRANFADDTEFADWAQNRARHAIKDK